MVLISDKQTDPDDFYESKKYTEAKAVREEGSEADLILVEGV